MGLYMAFVGCSLFSVICSGFVGSLASVLELWLMYSFLTLSIQATTGRSTKGHGAVRRHDDPALRDRLIAKLFPAFNGITWPFEYERDAAKGILATGHFYNEHYPFWYSKSTRPNGLFFLEPSFMSEYAAFAALYFRRLWLFVFFVYSVILSTGAMGVVTLAVAAPFLLARESPRTVSRSWSSARLACLLAMPRTSCRSYPASVNSITSPAERSEC
jgi:hypothetical protein